MKEAINVIFMILVLIVTLIAVLFITGRKMKKCCDLIIKDLTSQKAFDPASAVDLPYCKKQLFQMGLRDYRPDAMKQLLKYGQVGMTAEEKFFLARK